MDDCVFCRIIKGDIPSDKVYEDEYITVIRDINPMKPVHLLVLPKKHYTDILDFAQCPDHDAVHEAILQAIPKLAEQEGVKESGFSVITNCGPDGGQSVFHLHFHLIGGDKIHWAKLAD